MSASRFATNDERTAKRISDALGTATEHARDAQLCRPPLAPWLGHLMVSPPGDRAAAADAGRGDAAAARRRARAGLRLSADPRQEAALLRGPRNFRRASCRRRCRSRPTPIDDGRALRTPDGDADGQLRSSRPRSRPTIPPMPASAGSRSCPSMRRSRRAPKPAREFEPPDDEHRTTAPGLRACAPNARGWPGKQRSILTTAWTSMMHAHQAHVPPAAGPRAASWRDYAARSACPQALIVEAALASSCRPTARTGGKPRWPPARPPDAGSRAARTPRHDLQSKRWRCSSASG